MVTAYGLYYKIQQFLLFAAFGMRDAITPIIAFSYGMRDDKRIKDCLKYGQLYTGAIMLTGCVVLEIFAVPFSEIFGLSGETLTLCVSAVRVISAGLVFVGINIAFQGFFQALGSGVASLIISVCRQLLFVFPIAIGFAQFVKFDENTRWLVWLAFPCAELLTAIISVFMLKKISQKIGKNVLTN